MELLIDMEIKPTVESYAERKKLSASIIRNATTIGPKTLAWVPVELLNVKSYQRDRLEHVMDIANNWEDSRCGVLVVSYDREECCFNVIDGQHRAMAAKIKGIEYLVCEIFQGMTISREATLFIEPISIPGG